MKTALLLAGAVAWTGDRRTRAAIAVAFLLPVFCGFAADRMADTHGVGSKLTVPLQELTGLLHGGAPPRGLDAIDDPGVAPPAEVMTALADPASSALYRLALFARVQLGRTAHFAGPWRKDDHSVREKNGFWNTVCDVQNSLSRLSPLANGSSNT